MIQFVHCTVSDLEELRSISIQTFRDTYEHMNEPEPFQLHLSKAFNKRQLQSELENPESNFYFIKKKGEILAYIKVNEGMSQTEPYGSKYLELERIYVLKNYQGQGLGRLLIEKSISLARVKNKEKVWLGVWEENPNAIAFYKRMGFEVIGTHTFMMGEEVQKDLVMEIAV